MENNIRVFRSFADAEEEDRRYYASLTPQQRVDLLLQIVMRNQVTDSDATTRFERVHRVVELRQS